MSRQVIKRRTLLQSLVALSTGAITYARMDKSELRILGAQTSPEPESKIKVHAETELFIPVTVCGCLINIETNFYYVYPRGFDSFSDVVKRAFAHKNGSEANAMSERQSFLEVCPQHRASGLLIKDYSFFRLGGQQPPDMEEGTLIKELRRHIRHVEPCSSNCICHALAWFDTRDSDPVFVPVNHPYVTKFCDVHKDLSIEDHFYNCISPGVNTEFRRLNEERLNRKFSLA